MKVGIFGAGQAGIMVAKWIPSSQEMVCFIDNHEKKQGTYLEKIPVVSLKDAIAKNIDIIWVAVLNKEASIQIVEQIKNTGFKGEIINIQDVRKKQSIRMAALRLIAEEIKKRNVSGEMAELGVFQGDFAKEMNLLFPEKKLYLFDTFGGFHEKDIEIEKKLGNKRASIGEFSNTSIELVKEKLPYADKAVFCSGYFPESLKQLKEPLPNMALVSLDPDLYEPVYQGLSFFYPKLSVGGAILIHDYNSIQFPSVKKAVEKYCEEHNLFVVPVMDLHGSAILIKQK